MVKLMKVFALSLSMAFLIGCGGEDDFGVGPACAGCDDDTPWSVAGSKECYYTFEDCDASERGTCTICN